MNVLKNRPAYHILMIVNSMQEVQFSNEKSLNRLSFFDIQRIHPEIRREDFFIGFDCTWSNVLMRIEEYQLLANLKQFELNLYYCNAFKSEMESYNSELNCINFHDCCVKQEQLEREFKIIQDLKAQVLWKEVEIDQLLLEAKEHTPSVDGGFLQAEPKPMLA